MKKERVINIRFLFCLFVGLVLGIITGKLFLMGKIKWWLLVLFIILVCLLMIVGVIYAKRTEEYNKSCRYREKLSFLLKCSSIGVFCSFVVGIVLVIYPMLNIFNVANYENDVVVSGVVSEYVDSEATYNKFILKDCYIIDGDIVNKCDGKILVYSSKYNNVQLGQEISFECELSKYDAFDSGDFSYLINNIHYSTYASVLNETDNVEITLRERVHKGVMNVLKNNLNEDNANISFAMMFGQKYSLSTEISQMFSYAGISHILAVSGLHVGVLVGILWFVLNKLKINKYVKLFIFALLLLFYNYLCMYSPSVCRASIMSFVLAMCKCFRWEYDSLSSLSLAGIIILLISPITLFSVSFQLSFLCIFAIIAFAPTINTLFDKIRCPKFLSSVLSISIATTIAILPVCLNVFAEVSLLGILANIFVLPIFSITYVLMFLTIVFTSVLPSVGVLLLVPNMFLHIIKVIANFFASVPFGVFRAFNIGYISLFFIIGFCLIVYYVMSRNIWKKVSAIIIALFFVITIGVSAIPKNYDNKLLICNQYKTGICFYAEDNEVCMIGSNIELKNLNYMMKELRLNKLDVIIAYDLQLNNLDEFKLICENFNVQKILIPSYLDYNEVKKDLINCKIIYTKTKFDKCTIDYIYRNDTIVGLDIVKENKNYIIPNIDNKKADNVYLVENYQKEKTYLVTKSNYWQELDEEVEKIYFEECSKYVTL